MSATATTIHVAVPERHPNASRRIGVFVKDVGIIQVEIPRGLSKGDQFCFQLKEGAVFPGAGSGATHLDCPDSSQPGDILHHCTQNGKKMLVCVPPPSEEYGYDFGLLVPNVFVNEHMIVQAQLAPKQKQQLDFKQRQYVDNPVQDFVFTNSTGDAVADAQAQLLKRFERQSSATTITLRNNKDASLYDEEEAQLAYAMRESLKFAHVDAATMAQMQAYIEYADHHQPPPSYMQQQCSVQSAEDARLREREDFLNSLPDDIRQQVLAQETLQERALH